MLLSRRYHKLAIKTSNPILIQKLEYIKSAIQNNGVAPLITSLLPNFMLEESLDECLRSEYNEVIQFVENNNAIEITDAMFKLESSSENDSKHLIANIQFSQHNTPYSLLSFLYSAYNPKGTISLGDLAWDDESIENVETHICLIWLDSEGYCSYWKNGNHDDGFENLPHIHYDRYDSFAQDVKVDFEDYYDNDVWHILDVNPNHYQGCRCENEPSLCEKCLDVLCDDIYNIGRVEDEENALTDDEFARISNVYNEINQAMLQKGIIHTEGYEVINKNKFIVFMLNTTNKIADFGCFFHLNEIGGIESISFTGCTYQGSLTCNFSSDESLMAIMDRIIDEANLYSEKLLENVEKTEKFFQRHSQENN